jgi:hypothetical protein
METYAEYLAWLLQDEPALLQEAYVLEMTPNEMRELFGMPPMPDSPQPVKDVKPEPTFLDQPRQYDMRVNT